MKIYSDKSFYMTQACLSYKICEAQLKKLKIDFLQWLNWYLINKGKDHDQTKQRSLFEFLPPISPKMNVKTINKDSMNFIEWLCFYSLTFEYHSMSKTYHSSECYASKQQGLLYFKSMERIEERSTTMYEVMGDWT